MRLVARSSVAADLMIVYDGEQALKLRRVKVDFIILDLAMPKFDGFMVLQNYRSSPSLAASGKKALALGATDFVTKPMRFQSYVVSGFVERWSGATAATELNVAAGSRVGGADDAQLLHAALNAPRTTLDRGQRGARSVTNFLDRDAPTTVSSVNAPWRVALRSDFLFSTLPCQSATT